MPTAPIPPVAVILTAAAGVLHLVAARGHVGVSGLLVAAFVAVGIAQVAVVATARRWPAPTLEAIVAIDLAAVGAWAVSRTVGLPLVGTEAVGAADLVVVALQLLAVLVAVLPYLAAARPALASGAVVASLVAVAVAAPGIGHAHGPSPVDGPSGRATSVAVVQLGPGDFAGDTDLTDPVAAMTMKELMTGAVSPVVLTSAGRVVGTPAEHAPGIEIVDVPTPGHGDDGHADEGHADDGHADDGHPHG
ncbi:MAG: hypothetical protein KY461_01545 [Actinobacteria bacterium]|nr:hypothetical protein [Actinomycetota bacterium]